MKGLESNIHANIMLLTTSWTAENVVCRYPNTTEFAPKRSVRNGNTGRDICVVIPMVSNRKVTEDIIGSNNPESHGIYDDV